MTAVELPSRTMKLIDRGIEAGIPWVTCRAPIYGAANGYVKIPEGHHWHGLDYNEIDVQAHGGLTYGGGESGWIGFDTLHSGDIWPAGPDHGPTPWDKHWTDELVAEETRALARRVAAAAYENAELSGAAALSILAEDTQK
ncbi:hypothetical protein JF780_05635 [Mycobacterium intracellulare]|uniref:hypothetical protein n=1 Tax=Mycobacterium intracellulare TaxID=1767 RepID=UPI001CD91D95|nr:hypothetical protein [Mycobacterium intracellulare]MCA2275472.1 hypothetical protein [Mycobacterium intracellulare]MCA2324432.1 hypothetical protein [Mycobacterium intracellulare]